MSQVGQIMVCDDCGHPCGNGNIFEAMLVADLDIATNNTINLHFCRDRKEDGKTVKGCAHKIISKHLTHFLEKNAPYKQPTNDPDASLTGVAAIKKQAAAEEAQPQPNKDTGESE
jgi:hypothetical protein